MRVFLISNMYPNKHYPSFGVFVKNFKIGIEEFGIKVTHKAVIKGKRKSIIGKAIAYLNLLFQILWFGVKGGYDVIYVHYINHTAIPVYLLSWFISKPIILNAHGSDVLIESKLSGIFQQFSKRVISKAKLVVVPSSYFKELVLEKFNLPDSKVHISASGGIDTSVFKPLKKRSLENKMTIGYVGRLVDGKGWDVMLNALNKLKSTDVDYVCKVVGGGKRENDFINMVKLLHLDDKIVYLGVKPQQELPEILNELDLFIFPTVRKAESLGLVGLEAMACKVPVIGSRIGGLIDYIDDGVNGFLFPYGDADQLKDCVVKFHKLKKEEKKKMAEEAYKTAQLYKKQVVMSELAKKIEEVV